MKNGYLWRVVASLAILTFLISAPGFASSPTFEGRWQTEGGQVFTCTDSGGSTGSVTCEGDSWSRFRGTRDDDYLTGRWEYTATSNPNPPDYPCYISLSDNQWIGSFYWDDYLTYPDTVYAQRIGGGSSNGGSSGSGSDPMWKIENGLCCPSDDALTFTVTIGSNTRYATNYGCDGSSAESDWATASAGSVTVYYNAVGSCINEQDGSRSDSLEKGKCYVYRFYLDGSDHSIGKWVTDCPGGGDNSFGGTWQVSQGTIVEGDIQINENSDGSVSGSFSYYGYGQGAFRGTRSGNTISGQWGVDGDYTEPWESGTWTAELSSDGRSMDVTMHFNTGFGDVDPYPWTFTATRK